MEGLNYVLHEPREIFGRATQKSPSGFVAFIHGFCNDGEDFGKNGVRIGANLCLQFNPIAFERTENLVSEIGVLSGSVLRQTENHRLSTDIVGASRITEHRTQPSITGKSARSVPANHRRARSGYDHETGGFPACRKGHA